MRKTIAALTLTLTASAFAQTTDATATRLIDHILASSDKGYETLAYLTDNIGPRLSGSKGAALAVQYTEKRFKEWGIDVRREALMVPHWVRGEERARLVSHNDQRIVLTALGGSVATPPAGITAEVIEITSFDQLAQLGRARIAG